MPTASRCGTTRRSDTAAEVDTEGYFDAASDMLRVGDMILANVDTDGTPGAGIYLVNAVAAGTVDVADLTVVGSARTPTDGGGPGPVRLPYWSGPRNGICGAHFFQNIFIIMQIYNN